MLQFFGCLKGELLLKHPWNQIWASPFDYQSGWEKIVTYKNSVDLDQNDAIEQPYLGL